MRKLRYKVAYLESPSWSSLHLNLEPVPILCSNIIGRSYCGCVRCVGFTLKTNLTKVCCTVPTFLLRVKPLCFASIFLQ